MELLIKYCGHILILLLIIYSETTSLSPSSVTDDCLVQFDGFNTTFNLCAARIGTGGGIIKYYQVQDSRNINNEDNTNTNNEYIYHFNIGGPLELIHPICENITKGTHNMFGYCPNENNCTSNTQLIAIHDPSWVYQVWFNKSNNAAFKCYRLTNEYGGPPEWSLYHEGDPSLGVQVTYLNGDHFGCKGNRKFNLRFICKDEILFIPDSYPLYEYIECEYTLELPSIYGCPIQCKWYDNRLCAGHGLCGFDWTNNRPRCFCYHQWIGDDCSIFNGGAVIPNNSMKIPPNLNSPFVKEFYIGDQGIDVNVIYDLSEFAFNNEVYVVHDLDYSRNHTYYVGIPIPVFPTPIQCDNITKPCTNIDNTTGQCLSGVTFGTHFAFIYQLNSDTNECLNLGTEVRWELYDIHNPAGGVTGIYYDGSWCAAGGKNMEFRIHLICPRDQDITYHPRNETKIDLYEYVEEDDKNGCSFSFEMESAIACPYQCVAEELYDNIDTFTVCHQKGICAADPNAGFVRCLCDEGWTGIDCTEIVTENPTTDPTKIPTIEPTGIPTINPTVNPTEDTQTPSYNPTEDTRTPSDDPTIYPSMGPTTMISTGDIITTTANIIDTEASKIEDKSTGFIVTIIILVIVVVLLIIGIGYFIYKNRKQKLQLERVHSVETSPDRTTATDTAEQALFNDDADGGDVETPHDLQTDEQTQLR